MSAGHSVTGSVYCSGRWVRGCVEYRDGIISRVVGIDIAGDPEPPYIIPGFIDLHVHGGGGADVMGGSSELATICEYHAINGTVALCATTVTAPLADIGHALTGAREYMDAPVPGAAEVLGVHLEGPFINPARLGGQPPFAIPPQIGLLAKWKDLAPLRIVTLAPELPGAEAAIRWLADHNIRVQVGHSLADNAVLEEARSWGMSGVAHLYNAGAPIVARDPGVAGWALANAEWAELICDLKHVHPDLLKIAIQAIPNPYFITDCCSAGGCPDGEYRLGAHTVVKSDGLVRLPDGQIAASVITSIEAFRNILHLTGSIDTAIAMMATRPARYIGESGLGVIDAGYQASFIVLDQYLSVTTTYVRGVGS